MQEPVLYSLDFNFPLPIISVKTMLFFLLPFLAAGTGWLLLLIALKVFLAQNRTSKWSLNYFIRKNKPALAEEIGNYAGTHVWDTASLTENLSGSRVSEALRPFMEQHINHFLEVKLVEQFPVIAMLGGTKITGQIKESLMAELEILLPGMLQQIAGLLSAKTNAGKLITEKIKEIPEERLRGALGRKLESNSGKIRLAGAAFGFLVGLVLMLFLLLFS